MRKVNYSQGKFKPKNPQKYSGDPTEIVFRSSYELKFMNYCDLRESIMEWKSEEFWIPYQDPISGNIKRYFPDFFIKYKDRDGTIRKAVIEVKPKKDLIEPQKNPKRKTKSWAYSVQMWVKNQAKWEAARKWCISRNYEFKIFDETELGIR